MAACGVKVRKTAIVSICFQLTLFVYVNGYSSFPTREAISKWAELFQNRLLKDFDKFTGMKNLEKKYDDLRKAKLVKVDGHSLVHRMSHELTKNLERKMEALERLVAAAEATVRNYKYDSLIKARTGVLADGFLVHYTTKPHSTTWFNSENTLTKDTDVSFVKMKDFKSDDPRLVYSEKFKNFVNFSYSGVHIPVEIYEEFSTFSEFVRRTNLESILSPEFTIVFKFVFGQVDVSEKAEVLMSADPDILNGLKWSAALDDIFKLNAENDSDIMWQYFGSQTGFMRTYPAHEWIILPRKPNFPDLYDVRLRPWYVHASSSPKDMIILMDSSGSMHGQTMEIMKIAVKTLLTTLGENDFVNIAFFNNTAEWITCFDTLVQANRRTKQILSRGVDELDDGGMAHLGLGLEFAFQAFAKFRENRTEHWAGANCNQIIMLFSDGGTEEAWEVLEKYNYDKSIRIFTYAIGPHPVPYATLKEIACTNRGFFTSIQAMGAVRTKIQDYVKVLGRPLALSSEKNFAWTNFYVDPNGLGMMTTVTLPVFNRTHGENQSIVGVMGVDVALERSMDHEPSYEIGPPGYSFGINRNGYVVFHPDLKTDTIFTDEPPHLDFMDVEIHSTAKEEVRNAMINMRSSKRALSSLIRMPNGKHIVRHHMEYYYTPVNKTSFSIAVVIPTDRTHFLVVEGKDIQEGLELREDEMRGMYLAPWKYCYKQVMKLNISDLLKNFSDTAATRPEMCRLHLLQRLVWDIQNTEDVMNYWASEELEFKRKGVMATFVQSEGGLTRIYPPSEGHRLSEQINPSRSLFYQRAFYGDDYVFIPPDNGYDYAPNQSDAVITVVKSISFSRSGITYKPAIVGVMVDPLWLQPYLLNTPSGPGKVPVSCGDVDYIICYLIDDGGFIISTNQPDMWNVLGKFLGYADAEIMTELYEKQIYARNEDFNYEDRCKKEVKVSAGFRLSALPFRSTLSAFNIGWLFDLSAWSQLIYWLLSFFAFARIPKSEALPEFYELANETTCNTHEAQYFWGRWGRSYSGNIICNNCTRHYSLAKVGQLNVLLLVTTKPCAPLFCDPVPPPLQAKEEVISPNITNCERLRDVPLRYRKRPDKCYYYSVDENNSECGAVGTLALPHLALIIELISFFIVTKIVHMDDNVPFAAHY